MGLEGPVNSLTDPYNPSKLTLNILLFFGCVSLLSFDKILVYIAKGKINSSSILRSQTIIHRIECSPDDLLIRSQSYTLGDPVNRQFLYIVANQAQLIHMYKL